MCRCWRSCCWLKWTAWNWHFSFSCEGIWNSSRSGKNWKMLLCIVDHGLVSTGKPWWKHGTWIQTTCSRIPGRAFGCPSFHTFFFWQLLMNLLRKRVLQYFCTIVYVVWLIDLKRLHQQLLVVAVTNQKQMLGLFSMPPDMCSSQ